MAAARLQPLACIQYCHFWQTVLATNLYLASLSLLKFGNEILKVGPSQTPLVISLQQPRLYARLPWPLQHDWQRAYFCMRGLFLLNTKIVRCVNKIQYVTEEFA